MGLLTVDGVLHVPIVAGVLALILRLAKSFMGMLVGGKVINTDFGGFFGMLVDVVISIKRSATGNVANG